AMVQLLSSPDNWTLVYMDGRSTVFGWNGPEAGRAASRWADLRLDPIRQAFESVPLAERIPASDPGEPLALGPLGRYMQGPGPRSLHSDESEIQRDLFDAMRDPWQARLLIQWRSLYLASVLGAAAPVPGAVATPALLAYHASLYGVYSPQLVQKPWGDPTAKRKEVVDRLANTIFDEEFMRRQDAGPPSRALLAVRAARRGVAESPQNAGGYVRLEKALRVLAQATQERYWIP